MTCEGSGGGQIAFCGWMSNPAEVTERAARLEKEARINTGIPRSPPHTICPFVFFSSTSLSPSVCLYLIFLCFKVVLFALSLSFALSLLILMSISMKISQISHQQGLSRKSTLLTLLWMEGGGFAEASWFLIPDMLQSEGLFEGSKGTMFVGGLD